MLQLHSFCPDEVAALSLNTESSESRVCESVNVVATDCKNWSHECFFIYFAVKEWFLV